MITVPLQLPEDLHEAASVQADAMGVSLDSYIAVALAARVGAQAEAEHGLAARRTGLDRDRLAEILARFGRGNPPLPGDELGEDMRPKRVAR